MTVLEHTVDHNFTDLTDGELKFIWSQAGRNLDGKRLIALAEGSVTPESPVERVYVVARKAMVVRNLPL